MKLGRSHVLVALFVICALVGLALGMVFRGVRARAAAARVVVRVSRPVKTDPELTAALTRGGPPLPEPRLTQQQQSALAVGPPPALATAGANKYAEPSQPTPDELDPAGESAPSGEVIAANVATPEKGGD